ncbi:unnamed protein product [Allacma fusca]|uniref:Uncharacterized protein n=1 Tax=Allacma fusca TaxID=39272 RepID=A0A8J2JGI4_9HEXA|nr:unnamed protein product [Allacma fusca]
MPLRLGKRQVQVVLVTRGHLKIPFSVSMKDYRCRKSRLYRARKQLLMFHFKCHTFAQALTLIFGSGE